MVKRITHHTINGVTMEITKIPTPELKIRVEYLKDLKIYDYHGERIIENMYVKGLWRYTAEYRALVDELESRKND